jgi:septum site-determining protein MinC
MTDSFDFNEEAAASEPESHSEVSHSGLVAARGTSDGLVIRLDARADQVALVDALREFLSQRQGFLKGNKVALEWVGAKPEDSLLKMVSGIISKDFGVGLESSEESSGSSVSQLSARSSKSSGAGSEAGQEEKAVKLSLFDGIEAIDDDEDDDSDPSFFGDREEGLWDDPDARIVYETLRSGKKIESEHTLIIVGDVNSGAEVVAGGDVIVLGALRGVAHAGAYEESGGGRFIFSLQLEPIQLRIGSVISRGLAEGKKKGAYAPEIAQVDGDRVVVEPFQARHKGLWSRSVKVGNN